MGGGAGVSDPKQEAIRWLNRMFNVPDGYSNGTVELIVDNLIKAAVAEIKATVDDSLTVQTATTEDSSAVCWVAAAGNTVKSLKMNADGAWEEA